MASTWPRSLVLAGAGKMGGALLHGWLTGGLSAAGAAIVDPYLDEDVAATWRHSGVSLSPPVTPPEVLVLAIKPQGFVANAAPLRSLAGPDTLVVSILAGTTLRALRTALPDAAAIVRAMPNLPASIGRGATGATAEPVLSSGQKAVAQTLLAAVGLVEWVGEELMDAVTALSGSGPAYVFYLTECLAEAGQAAGLPADVAARLARATVEGAAALMRAEPGRAPADLRASVTSPGGTTAAALSQLSAPDGLAALMSRAVRAARRRAQELGGPN
jgi:pyrroline-5-carboxylate reductase